MADELAESCPCRLEDLCVKFVGANGSLWNAEQFLGIPRHLLFPILKKFHPFDVERLEVSGVFQTIGIDTDPVWRGFYLESWPRKNKWPDVYFKTKGISKGGEGWRVCYLQRRLQDALNSRHALSKVTSCSSSEVTQSLQNIVSVCGRYATYLRLYNSACVLLAENLDIFLRLAEHIEFLEVFLLRDNGVSPLCHLLQVLTTKRLKSVGFCFCKVSDVQMWSRIIHSLSKRSQEKYGVIDINAKAENLIACTPAQTTTGTCTCDVLTQGGNTKSYDFGKQTCNQLNHEQDRESTSRESSVAQADENVTCNESLQGMDDFDIYEFTDSSAVSNTEQSITTLSSTCHCTTHARRSDTKEISGNVIQSLDLYDEVFGHSTDATKELSPCPIMQVPEEASEQCRFSPGASKLETSFLSTLSCSLVHFELVGFWLLPDVLALFVHTLKGWLTLESLILDDNALSFVSIMPGCEFIDTLSFLCANGRLQFLQMTNNPVNDEFAKLFFEKLVSAFCLKCNDCNNTRSLTKLKFSSNHVSPVFSEYLGRAIRDVCACKLSNQSTAEMSESIPCVTDCKDCTQAGCGKQKCSRVLGHCVTCESDKTLPLVSWKTNSATKEKVSFDHMSDNTQEAQVSTKINAKQQSRVNQKEMANESGEESSQGKKPLPFTRDNSNVFVGIQVLQLGCAVGDRGASFIADGLRSNSTLRSLSLANCEISPVGLADIFQALSGNRYLKHLCVKGNHYDPSNCDSLAEMLVCNNTLTDLDLGSCDLRGLSKKMIHALCINNTLTSLKLARNGLGNADMSALSQVFSHPSQLSKLTKLDLSFNFIFPESLSVLASSLQSIRPRKLDELKLTQSRPCPAFHQVLLSLHSVVQNVIVEYLDPATLFADFVSQM